MRFPVLIHNYLELAQERYADKDFLICGSNRYTYRQVYRQSLRLARGLLDAGLHLHDRAAVLMDNSAEAVVSVYGIAKAGGTVVAVNSTIKPSKLRYILENSGAKFLIAQVTKSRVVLRAVQQMEVKPLIIWANPDRALDRMPDSLGPSIPWDSLLEGWDVEPSGDPFPRLIDQDLAALIYTSGSTGDPKGVMQPHGRMVSTAWNIIHYLRNTDRDVILNVLSLAFGYGLYQVLMAAMFGGTVVLEKSFVYLKDVLSRIPEYQVTGFPLIPTVLALLFQMQDTDRFDFSSLRYLTNAGAALPAAYARRFRSTWPHVDIYPMYGLTECVRVSYLEPRHVDARPDSVGSEIPNCRTLIVDEDGAPVGPNRTGELVVTGTNVMPGYWRDPELTARVFRPGPRPGQTHLYTGDLFRRDEEGFLYFVGRKDDMIKSRGERISPLEVENLLLAMDAVAEAAVIGVPDEILGNALKAFVVPRAGSGLTELEVLKYSSLNMENCMIPKYVVLIEELPKTPNGKVDKKALISRQGETP